MKFIVTADWHIEGYDERYEVARWILQKAQSDGATVIVAGDILDKGIRRHAVLDDLFGGFDVPVYVIRGNHDVCLSSGYVTSSKVCVVDEPEVEVMGGVYFMFIPYPRSESTPMYGYIKKLFHRVEGKKWILVSHGDWVRGSNGVYEDAYFPLTIDDVREFSPAFVFLGHIHKWGYDAEYNVFYPGSPLPIARDEYGVHYIIEFDSDEGKIVHVPVSAAPLYLKEEVCVVPGDYRGDVDSWLESVAAKYEGHKVAGVEVELFGITDLDRKALSDYVHMKVSSLWEGADVKIYNGVRLIEDVPDVVLKFVEDIRSMADKRTDVDEQELMEAVWRVVSKGFSR